ncbi:MAG: phosphatidate cytidylyltransferase [Eubacteriales bacterium]|nr:phosphatidate cytidylyltransferase [Eubacteriales bacterium]
MKKRLISACVLLTIALTCVFLSEYTRVLFFAAAGICCAYEYSRGLEKINVYCAAWVMYTYIAIQAVLAVFHAGTVLYIACMATGVYLALFSGIIHPKVRGSGAIYTVAGLAYPGIIYGLMMMICVSRYWKDVLILGCFSSWLCDCFALLGGMKFGKHKIAPDISPKKTVEGCICGAIAGTLTGALIRLIPFLCPDVSWGLALITCFVASTMGQIGDLAESLIKRMLGLKDFSNLIPGHGGMFDRSDSIMFAVPAAYLCLYIAGLIS